MAFHSSVMADHELFGLVVDAPAAHKKESVLIELTCSWMHKYCDGQVCTEKPNRGAHEH